MNRQKPVTAAELEIFEQRMTKAFDASRQIPEGWNVGAPPSKDQYIVIDAVYWHLSIAYYEPAKGLGWCINGRWLGHDAVALWREAPDIPERRN